MRFAKFSDYYQRDCYQWDCYQWDC